MKQFITPFNYFANGLMHLLSRKYWNWRRATLKRFRLLTNCKYNVRFEADKILPNLMLILFH
jgi:hypothetical protein